MKLKAAAHDLAVIHGAVIGHLITVSIDPRHLLSIVCCVIELEQVVLVCTSVDELEDRFCVRLSRY